MWTYKNIETFLSQKRTKIDKLPLKPIIMEWMNYPSMNQPLEIIDKKVAYLLNQYQAGGETKLIQWFLTNDRNFLAITAERYIIDYLKSRNRNIEDSLRKVGIDAKLRIKDGIVGIEVTTLNGFVVEWIFSERLTDLLDSKNILADKTLRIKYDHARIMEEKDKIYSYLKDVIAAIEAKDIEKLKILDISVKFEQNRAGLISWDHKKVKNFRWCKYLTSDLLKKLSKSNKKRQLMGYPKNIVFVGVNQIAPPNQTIPSIFEEIGLGGSRHSLQIEKIENFWSDAMEKNHNIMGICFFCYSIEKEEPFYPLRIFWSNRTEKLPINL